jgi:hypothetical protein
MTMTIVKFPALVSVCAVVVLQVSVVNAPLPSLLQYRPRRPRWEDSTPAESGVSSAVWNKAVAVAQLMVILTVLATLTTAANKSKAFLPKAKAR